uniref:Uncharacterized protein LOC100369476 n=1 Tax=Saccoglossus kowalevskii TaxID=10224 RepID=A0ABM0MEG1_SACKO|nr:PREDICTED: uncharacterized protein LOC100369476 [Saccoglossus kowalevskii]
MFKSAVDGDDNYRFTEQERMPHGDLTSNQLRCLYLCIPLTSIVTYIITMNIQLGVQDPFQCAVQNQQIDVSKSSYNNYDAVENLIKSCDFLRTNNRSIATDRYLIIVWNVPSAGPSTMYNLWRIAVKFAVFQQRTLFIRPFNVHKTHKPRDADTTFDSEKLREMLPIADETDYISHCGNTLEANNVFIPPTIAMETKEVMFQKYEQLIGWKAVFQAFAATRILNSIPGVTTELNTIITSFGNSASNDYYSSRNEKCLALFATDDVNLPCNDEINELVDKHLVRAPYIRRMAEEFIPKVCEGEFALLFWVVLYKDKTFKKSHMASIGSQCDDVVRPRCKTLHHCKPGRMAELKALHNALDGIVTSIKKLLASYNLSCIYVAAPIEYKQVLTNNLRNKSLSVFGLNDVFKMVPKSAKYRNDNYVLSLIEQEIAERVPLFISSRTSNWSFYVEYTRTIRRMRTVAVQELPGVPQDLINMFQVLK